MPLLTCIYGQCLTELKSTKKMLSEAYNLVTFVINSVCDTFIC